MRTTGARDSARRSAVRPSSVDPRLGDGVGWRGSGVPSCALGLDEGAGDVEPSAIDRERVRAGEHARAKIIAFIRRQIPQGSADRYTSAELAAFNARRLSRVRFDPYET